MVSFLFFFVYLCVRIYLIWGHPRIVLCVRRELKSEKKEKKKDITQGRYTSLCLDGRLYDFAFLSRHVRVLGIRDSRGSFAIGIQFCFLVAENQRR